MEIGIILEKIKGDGHRLTKVRKAIVEIFAEERCLLSPSDILSRLSALHIKADRSTVYRELCFLLEKNVIKKIRLADHKAYYEKSTADHHHLICTRCNCVQEITLDSVLKEQESMIYKKEGFKVVSHSLEFFGLCGNCAGET